MTLNLFRWKQSEKLTPEQDTVLPKTDYKIPAKYFKIVEKEYNSGRKSATLYSTNYLIGTYSKNKYFSKNYSIVSSSSLDGWFVINCYSSVEEAKKAAQEMYNEMQEMHNEMRQFAHANTVKHSNTEYIS
jgi:DNA/RNA endonuclease G (NUC1)